MILWVDNRESSIPTVPQSSSFSADVVKDPASDLTSSLVVYTNSYHDDFHPDVPSFGGMSDCVSNIFDLPHTTLHVESSAFEKGFDVVHDFVVAGDCSKWDNVERSYAVEILTNVATSVGNISDDANPVSPSHPSVFSLGVNAPDHSSWFPADQAQFVFVDASISSYDDDDVPITTLGKSRANKSSHFVPTEVGPSSRTRSSRSTAIKRLSGSNYDSPLQSSSEDDVALPYPDLVAENERFLETFLSVPIDGISFNIE